MREQQGVTNEDIWEVLQGVTTNIDQLKTDLKDIKQTLVHHETVLQDSRQTLFQHSMMLQEVRMLSTSTHNAQRALHSDISEIFTRLDTLEATRA